MMSNYNWGFLPSSGQVFEYVCVLLLLLLLLLGLPVATITRHSYRFPYQVFHVSVPYCVARGEARVESASSRSLSSSSESISTSFDDVGDAFPKSNRFVESTSGSNESCSTSSN